MIIPLIDKFENLYYQLDEAKIKFSKGHYSYLSQLNNQQQDDLVFVLHYLMSVGKHNINSFNRHRNEIEKLLLWLFNSQYLLVDLNQERFKEYFSFIASPPETWQSQSQFRRFIFKDGIYQANVQWRPCTDSPISYESRASTFTVINAFSNKLSQSNVINNNPVKSIRKSDPILNQLTKLSQSSGDISISKNALTDYYEKIKNNIHHTRDCFIFYLVRHKNIPLQSLSRNNNNQSKPLFSHLSANFKVITYFTNGKHYSTELCTFGQTLAKQYANLRGYSNQNDFEVALFHKNKGTGAYEVRQLRRIIKKLEHTLLTGCNYE